MNYADIDKTLGPIDGKSRGEVQTSPYAIIDQKLDPIGGEAAKPPVEPKKKDTSIMKGIGDFLDDVSDFRPSMIYNKLFSDEPAAPMGAGSQQPSGPLSQVPNKIGDWMFGQSVPDATRKEHFSRSATMGPFTALNPQTMALQSKLGYGPFPFARVDEAGVPVDKAGKPYVETPEPLEGSRKLVSDVLMGIGGFAAHPMETYRGAADFFLSIPGFITGVYGIAEKVARKKFDDFVYTFSPNPIMWGWESMQRGTLNDVADIIDEELQKYAEYYEPTKEALVGEPTEQSSKVGETIMAPFNASVYAFNEAANSEKLKDYPNIRGLLRITGNLVGFLITGKMIHVPSKRVEFVKKAKKLSDEATRIVKVEEALDNVPEGPLKEAQKKAAEMEKTQLDLRVADMAKQLNKNIVMAEEMGRVGEELAKESIRPVQPLTEQKGRPEGQKLGPAVKGAAEFTFTSKRGNEYYKVGDKWYDADGEVVSNTHVIGAAEKGKVDRGTGQKEKPKGTSVKMFITKAEEAELRNRGYTQEQINKMRPAEAEEILSKPKEEPAAEVAKAEEPVVEQPKPAEPAPVVGEEPVRSKIEQTPEPKLEPLPPDEPSGIEPPGAFSSDGPFASDLAKAEQLEKLYEDNAKSVATEPDTAVMKLINDVNLWRNGREVDIEKTRELLSQFAMAVNRPGFADQFFHSDMVGFERFKDLVEGAAKWARRADRLKIEQTEQPPASKTMELLNKLRENKEEFPKGITDKDIDGFIKAKEKQAGVEEWAKEEGKGPSPNQLNMMIPLDEIPKVVKDILNKTNIARKDIYRNYKIWKETGFWFGKDGFWRFEFFPDDLRINKEAIERVKQSPTETYTPLREIFSTSEGSKIPGYDNTVVHVGDFYGAWFEPDLQVIHIGKHILQSGNERIHQVFHHEVQHGINRWIGAFKGGSPEARFSDSIKNIAKSLSNYIKDDAVRNELYDLENKIDWSMSREEINREFHKITDKTTNKEVEGIVDVLTEGMLKLFWDSADRRYLKLPGEMESRLSEVRNQMTPLQRSKEPPWETLDKMLENEGLRVGAGRRLYSDPLGTQAMLDAAKRFRNYVFSAHEMKSFKPKEAASRVREEFNRDFIDKEGNIRRELLEELGDEGYRIVQKSRLSKGATAWAADQLKQMRKEVYSGLSKLERKILDSLILATRIVDIAGYKSTKQFKFPKDADPISSVMYKELFEYIEKLTPEQAAKLQKRTDAYFEWMKKPLKDMLEAELISKEEYDALVAHNYRKLKLIDVIDHKYKVRIGGKVRNVYDSGIERLARGRDTDIFEPSSEVMALEVFNRAYGRILNNRANMELAELARSKPDNPFARFREKGKKNIPTGWRPIFFYEGGKRTSLYVSPEVGLEWLTSSPEMTYKTSQFLRLVSGSPILRTFATGVNIGFAFANMPRDVMHLWYAARVLDGGKWQSLYSPHFPVFAGQIAMDLARVAKDAAVKGPRYKSYIESGGGMEFLVHQGRLFQRGKHVSKPFDKYYDFFGWLGEFSELSTRLAIRERVIRRRAKERGLTMEEARKDQKIKDESAFAARDYMDFGAGGGIAKVLDNGLPYLNAGIQGTRGFFRAFKPGSGTAMNSAWKLAQFGLLVTSLTIAMRKLAPETTEELRGNIDAENNLIIPLGDNFAFEDAEGQKRYMYIKIPMDPGQKFFKTAFEAATDKWLGHEVDVDRVVDSLKDMSPTDPSELPPTISGLVGYLSNRDFWTNEEIWKRRGGTYDWQPPKMLTGEQFGGSEEEYIPGQTPNFMTDVGAVTGLSPERLDYAVGELVTRGTIWSWIMGKAYDAAMGGDREAQQMALAQALARTPVVKRFFGVTNPYSKHSGKIDKEAQYSDIKRFVNTRDFDAKVDSWLTGGEATRADVRKFLRGIKEVSEKERLYERLEWKMATKDLPEKSFWMALQNINKDARARVFVDRFDKATPEKKRDLRKEMAIVGAAGGVLTDEFWDEVAKVRSQKRREAQ